MQFFIAYIMVPVFGALGSVRFDICRKGKQRPGIRCNGTIPFYANCNLDDKFETKFYLYSLFTGKEVLQVERFFRERFGHEVVVEETHIPRPRRSMYPAYWEAQSHGLFWQTLRVNSRLLVYVSVHYERRRFVCGPDYYDPSCSSADSPYYDTDYEYDDD